MTMIQVYKKIKSNLEEDLRYWNNQYLSQKQHLISCGCRFTLSIYEEKIESLKKDIQSVSDTIRKYENFAKKTA
jgi:hypothetical protein